MAYKGPKGRNISNRNLVEIYDFINNFKPKTDKKKEI